MSKNTVLNKTHLINPANNQLRYVFPRTMEFKNSTMAVSHLSVYFSWFNINKKLYNNDFFQYKFWDLAGDLTETFDVTIPDGYYDINTLNEYFQSVMIKNGHFMINVADGKYKYFLELLTNETYYSVEVRLTSCSESMLGSSGVEAYTETYQAVTGWKPPTNFETAELLISSNNKFGELVGFEAQTISKDLTSLSPSNDKVYSFLSDFTPNLLPASSYIVTCSLINNDMSVPNNVLHAFTIPLGVEFGQLINSNTDLVYSSVKDGSYSEFTIEIYDQDFNRLAIRDPNMLIMLSFLNVGSNK
jgi:hypothetical protein